MKSAVTKSRTRVLRPVLAFSCAVAWLLVGALSAHAATPDLLAAMQAQLSLASAQLQQIKIVHPAGEVLGAAISPLPSLTNLKAQLAEVDAKISALQTQRTGIVAQIAKVQNALASSSAPAIVSVNAGTVRNAVLTTAVNSGTHDFVTYTLSVDMTAVNRDVYVAKNPAKSVLYELQNIAGTSVGKDATTVKSFTSTAKLNAGGLYYVVPKGSTATFTVAVNWNPNAASPARGLQLLGLKYSGSAAATSSATWNASPVRNYRTDSVSTSY